MTFCVDINAWRLRKIKTGLRSLGQISHGYFLPRLIAFLPDQRLEMGNPTLVFRVR